MSSESDVVAGVTEAFQARDLPRFLQQVHEDVTWRPVSMLLGPARPRTEPYRGHDGIRRWFEDLRTWEGYTVRTLETVESGEHVFVSAVATLAREATWLARPVFLVFTVRAGRVSELRSFKREYAARAFAGLPQVQASIAEDAHHVGSLQVPADPASLSAVRDRLREAAEQVGMDPMAANDLLVAVSEAITNAILHGRPDSEGAIGIRWGVEDDVLAVCVDDRGHFAHNGEKSLDEHGRGLAVMRLLVDDLSIETREDRTLVRLAKRLAPAVA